MNYKNFSELLKDLRLKKGWSQEDACNGVCDRRTYIRWEKGMSEPSDYYLHLLSYRFNYDLQAYYKLFICNGSMNTWSYKQKANALLENRNWLLLYEYIEDIRRHTEFKTGENKETILYYMALYYYEYKKNYTLSTDYCIQGLKVENEAILASNPTEKIYSNVGICLLNCLAASYEKLQEIEKSNNIYIGVLNNIENKVIPSITYYQSTEFEKKIYLTVAYNLGLNYKRTNDIDLSLNIINKGIEFSVKHHYLNGLPDLLKLKYKLLYIKENYTESKQAFEQCTNLFLLQNNIIAYTQCWDDLYSAYPNII